MRNLLILKFVIPAYLLITFGVLVAVLVEAFLAPPVLKAHHLKFRQRLSVVAFWPFLMFSTKGRRLIGRAVRGL